MNKRLKIISITTTLCLCLMLFAVGVFAATSVTLNVTSSITFKSNGAYVMATGQVYRGGVDSTFAESDKLLETDRPSSDTTVGASYSYKGHSYTPISDSNDEPDGSMSKDLEPWTIGQIELLSDEPVIKYEIVFKNYGETEVEVTITGMPNDIEGVEITADPTTFTLGVDATSTFEVTVELIDFRTSFEPTDFSLNVSLENKNVATQMLTYTYEVLYDSTLSILDRVNLLDDGVTVELNSASGSFTVEDGSVLTLVEKINTLNVSAFDVIQFLPSPTPTPIVGDPTLYIRNTENVSVLAVSYYSNSLHFTTTTYTVSGK